MSETRLLRIVQISKYDSAGGGASRVAEQLTEALISKGHHVIHYTRGAAKGFNKVRRPLYGVRTKKLMGWMAKRGWIDVVPFELPRLLCNINIWRADVIHFHDISGTLSPFTVMFLSWFKKVVWTLHDASVITAGCIQPMACEKFKTHCGKCPQLGRWPLDTRADRTAFLHSFRRYCLKLNNAQLISPSQWLADVVNQTSGKKVKVVPNGIDTKVFHPQAWEAAQGNCKSNIARLQTSRKFRLLLVATNFDDPVKGMDLAMSIVQKCNKQNIVLVIMGHNDLQHRALGCETFNLGFVENQQDKAAYFAACDGLLFCSRGDNYPLVLLEAIACDLDVFAMAVGGVGEIVALHPYSKASKDIGELLCLLNLAIENKQHKSIRKKQTVNDIDWDTCVGRYESVLH